MLQFNKVYKIVNNNHFVLSIVVLFLFTLLARNKDIYDSDYYLKWQFLALVSIIIILSVFLIYLKNPIDFYFEVGKFDILILSFLVYVLVRNYFSSEINLDRYIPFCLTLVSIISFKKPSFFLKDNQKLLSLIIILIQGFVLVECIYGFFQYFKIFKSFNDNFSITGTFNNPGPYGIWLAINLPLSVVNLYTIKYKPIKYLSIICIFSSVFMIMLTQSRTAWYCSLPASLLLIKYASPKLHKLLKTKYSLGILIIIGMLLSYLIIFEFKEISANSRIFIWKLSLKLIRNAPLFGYGFGSFEKEFGLTRSQYFQSGNASDQEIYLGGKVSFAFNEYLHILVELGIVGAVLFFGSIFYLLIVNLKSKNSYIQAFSFCLTSILIAGFFSYPLQVPGIWSIFLICLIVLYKFDRKVIARKVMLWCTPLVILICSEIVFKVIHIFSAKKKSLEAYSYFISGDFNKAIPLYEEVIQTLDYDYTTLLPYANALSKSGDYNLSNYYIDKSKNLTYDVFALITQGDNYRSLNNLEKCRESYTLASWIEPTMLYPQYLLVKTNIELKDYEKACYIANKILKMRIKTRSAATAKIQAEMIGVLENCKNN